VAAEELRRDGNGPVVLLSALVVLVVAGATLMFFRATAVFGLVMCSAGLAIAPLTYSALDAGRIMRDTTLIPWRVIWSLALGVSLALAPLALIGQVERGTYTFARHYGIQVKVQIPDRCIVNLKTSHSIAKCGDATWRVDGRLVTGTLIAPEAQIVDPNPDTVRAPGQIGPALRNDAVDAWAYADKAIADDGGHGVFYPIGLVPIWLLGPLAACFLILAIRKVVDFFRV
jgi:hypothetical protein